MSAVPALREVLAGTLGETYGALPIIPLPQDNELLIGFIQAAAEILKDKGLYRRDMIVVTPYTPKRRLEVMHPKTFCSWSQRHMATNKKKYTRAGEPFYVVKDMPTEVAEKVLLSTHDFIPSIPEIEVVNPVPMPALRENGDLVLLKEGYDAATKTFTFPLSWEGAAGSADSPYDETWTAAAAGFYLRKLLGEFPVGDYVEVDGVKQSRSLSVVIGAMLSQFAGGLVPRRAARMGFILNANSQRSGKTLLVKIVTMPLYGSFKAQTWKTNEDDLQKVLDAEVLSGASYICFDNVRSYVGSPALEALMTTPVWTGRVLGVTEMFVAENRVTLFITGNALDVSSDMMHRCLFCDLIVPEGNVQERTVTHLIDEVWLEDGKNRRDLLSALWAIVKEWHAAGMPSASDYGFKPRKGFERWGDIIGGMVAFAGFGNCLEPVELENAGDSEDRDIRLLIGRLVDLCTPDPRGEYTFQQVVNTCADNGLFSWKLKGKEAADGNFKLDPSSNSAFSKLLLKFAPAKAPRSYHLPDGDQVRTVFFSNKGEARDRRYIVETRRSA